ncbi:MAG: DUF547 domain-containing protein [Acidiferrobacterales bacterium]
MPKRNRLPVFLIAFTIALTSFTVLAAPKAKLWERWTAHDPTATTTIDHGRWQRFLETYVRHYPDGINRVRYASVTDAAKSVLDDYAADLAAIPISVYNRAEQRAYWINLYNALTVKVILEHYPVKSIREISGWFTIGPWRGPWNKKLITVEGKKLSLNDIEHRILRPIWRDPRIHYGVNCASIGCPNLRDEAFTAVNAEALLTRAAREYINNPRGAQIKHGRLIVSSIYTWFQEDFEDSDEGVIRHLQLYAGPPLASALARTTRIADDQYDWALNDVMSVPEQ